MYYIKLSGTPVFVQRLNILIFQLAKISAVCIPQFYMKKLTKWINFLEHF